MDSLGDVPTRTKRRLCSHPRWVLAARGKHERCVECGDRFPCKDCEHLDCVEARKTAGSQEQWPEWVEEVDGTLRISFAETQETSCACGVSLEDCLGC